MGRLRRMLARRRPKLVSLRTTFAISFAAVTAAALTGAGGAVPEGGAAGVNDLAAIIFTTGSTGPPKGVQYTHGIFHTQLELIRDYYGIGPADVDQPGFPLFGLFATALVSTLVRHVARGTRWADR